MRRCSEIDGLWGPTVCSAECVPQHQGAILQEDIQVSAPVVVDSSPRRSREQTKKNVMPKWAEKLVEKMGKIEEKLAEKIEKEYGK